jgi:valyl-tRNA synthetase
LFFWVARMIMMGIEFTGKPPFHTVYLHGLIRDEHGQKMSKTKGNVIDPLGVMNEMGTDALRFTLLVGSTPGNDANLSIKKVEANRNFANKIWNIGRFIIGTVEDAPKSASGKPEWTLADSWVWARLQELIRTVDRLFETYQYGEAGRQIYDFLWNDFADWYVEIAKLQMSEGGDRAYYTAVTLVRVLDTALRLLHPFTPFVTEEIWGHLKTASVGLADATPVGGWEEALMLAHWPKAQAIEGWEDSKIADFNRVQEVVRAIRNARAEKKVTPGKKIAAIIAAGENKAVLEGQKKTLTALAFLDESQLTLTDAVKSAPEGALSLLVAGVEVYLPLAGMVDMDAERARLTKELAEAESQIARLKGLLGSDFASKAPAALVDKERAKLAAFEETAAKIKAQL